MNYFRGNIVTQTTANRDYRRVVYTTTETQLVLMSLEPSSEIAEEVHHDTTQFFRIEAGRGFAEVDGRRVVLRDDVVMIVPSGVKHRIVNTSTTDAMKIYTLYSPPHHPENLIQRTQPEEESGRV